MSHPRHPDPPNEFVYDTDRDPRLDHEHELHPRIEFEEDLSDVVRIGRDGRPRQVKGSNVDDDGVAHFLRIHPDPGVPDLCGGCGEQWPCSHRVAVDVAELPAPDPAEERLHAVAVDAVRAALAQERRG